MTSDPATPDLESNSALPDAELTSTSADLDANSIVPTAELNSVLLYLQSHPAPPDFEVDSAIVDVELIPAPAKVESNSLMPDIDEISTLADLDDLESPILENRLNKNIQVQFKTEEGRLLLILPTESQVSVGEFNWDEIWQQIRQRLQGSDRFRSANTPVHLLAQDRLLDSRQLQELAEVLSEVQLQLKSVATSRRQTAIAAVSSGYSVEQLQPETSLSSESKVTPQAPADALYLEMTVRSGVEIRHPGTVIILGDLNPGGIVVADGDILVWGRLRGVAHAGALGNRECLIMALQMEPTQLRIADAVARAPEKSPMQFSPEVAHITPQGIRIARAIDFSRSQINRITLEP
ncbi:septum site-determining protein MinC [Calothrix sp. PCC 7507]|uniref:septum site-determining protein MinC n=1 Tax=Calothrix sp. PCC 7507 TaxID=99598 RepID=UPI00029ED255|nr:septum site-determining protein MinC [Calothrix sp. PCC 7507]AFY35369.1 septum site-determining protein MinC [Calothrix sp. PCC 7507]